MDVKEYLKLRKIEFKTFLHPPVFTCDEAEKYNKEIKGIHSKNLFLKNRKSKRFYLLIIAANKKADLNEIGKFVNDDLKFANEDDLRNILGLTPGAVSPFGLINDKEHKVKVLIDSEVWNSEFVSFHPNLNTETLELRKEDFRRFIESGGNEFEIIWEKS